MKRLIALILALLTIFAMAIPAMADSLYAIPGKKNSGPAVYYTAGSQVSVRVSTTLRGDDKVRVFLDAYDPDRGYYVERDSVTFNTPDYHSATLSYTLDSNETKVRVRTYGYEGNSGTVGVDYTFK